MRNNNSTSSSSNSRCAACKYLRRKCSQDCILAPYFPSSNPHRFAYVHKIFGASNITKMLEQLPVHLRGEAAECICFEASSRVRDPVYGCVGIISILQQQIIQSQTELLKTQAQVAHYNAQQQQQEEEEEEEQEIAQDPREKEEEEEEEPLLWLNSNQQADPPLYLNHQMDKRYVSCSELNTSLRNGEEKHKE